MSEETEIIAILEENPGITMAEVDQIVNKEYFDKLKDNEDKGGFQKGGDAPLSPLSPPSPPFLAALSENPDVMTKEEILELQNVDVPKPEPDAGHPKALHHVFVIWSESIRTAYISITQTSLKRRLSSLRCNYRRYREALANPNSERGMGAPSTNFQILDQPDCQTKIIKSIYDTRYRAKLIREEYAKLFKENGFTIANGGRAKPPSRLPLPSSEGLEWKG